MVIILQQATDNGKRFVSTVVEDQEGTCTSGSFSTVSQNSISERSAIYKQRIDSLFGRHTRMNKFKPNATEPFRIRIQGGNVTSTNGSPQTQAQGKLSGTGSKATNIQVNTKDSMDHILSSEDEDFHRNRQIIPDKIPPPSIVPDSLNTCIPKKPSLISNNNVSSIKITCGSGEEEMLSTNTVCSLSDEIPGNSSGAGSGIGEPDNLMWRNRIYGGDTGTSTSPEEKQYGISRSPTTGGSSLRFPVEYLGSVPVEGTTTALQDLQAPLRALYLDFLTGKNVLSGHLAITSDGLRFEASKVRLVNPFTTIAVWAAIKFVTRGEPFPTECAFMPLISDPEGQDKGRLFGKMGSDLAKVYMSCVNGNGSSNKTFRNPPIFACVMREASFSLDCHAFACKCAEDAIVVAANLYQSLVDKMRTVNKEGESGYGSLRNSPQTQNSPNQKRSSSSASSNISPIEGSGGSCSGNNGPKTKRENRVVFSDTESVIPIRPPRRKKKHAPEGLHNNLKRYNSEDSVLLKMPQRRKSFKGNYHNRPHYSKSKKRVQISTPDETSSDSVNESIDQVLDRIINPGGMSFNDLKPSYQELILKIALTLTQDQLYQKSKQAMKKHQSTFSNAAGGKKNGKSSGGDCHSQFEHPQFLGNFLKSFSKISPGSKSNNSSGSGNSGGSKRYTNSIFPGASRTGILLNGTRPKQQSPPKVILKKNGKEEESFMSFCSGCMCERCSEKCYCSLPSKHNVKIVGLPSTPSSTSPSEMTKKTWSEKGKKVCGYDTDSCADSEKCYCSLQRIRSNGLKIYNINLDTETSDTDTNSYDLEPFNQPESATLLSSGMKTSSSSPSHSVEILSYHPSKRSSSILSPPAQFQTSTTSAVVHFDDNGCNGKGSTSNVTTNNVGAMGPSGILNSTNTRNHSSHNSCLSKHLHSEDPDMDSPNTTKKKKVLLITGSTPTARVVFKDHPPFNHSEYSDGKKSRIDRHRNLGNITEDEDSEEDETSNNMITEDDERGNNPLGPEKVLAMKKTAEIAAMFTDLRLDQTTNLVPEHGGVNYEANQTSNEDSNGSLDFETSLGYLP